MRDCAQTASESGPCPNLNRRMGRQCKSSLARVPPPGPCRRIALPRKPRRIRAQPPRVRADLRI